MSNQFTEKARSLLGSGQRYLSDRSQPHGVVYTLLALANDQTVAGLDGVLSEVLTNWAPLPSAMQRELRGQIDSLGSAAPGLSLAKALAELLIDPKKIDSITAVATLVTQETPKCVLAKLLELGRATTVSAAKRKACFVQLATACERRQHLDLLVTALELAAAADPTDAALAARLRNAVAGHHLAVSAVGEGRSARDSVRDPAKQAALEVGERIGAVSLSEVDQLRASLAKDQRSAATAARLADLLIKRGSAESLAEAVAALEAADRVGNPRAEYLLARARRKQLQLARALADPRTDPEVLELCIIEARALCACDAKNLEFNVALARLLVGAERFLEAIPLLQQALHAHTGVKERIGLAQELAVAFARQKMFAEAYVVLQWCVMQPGTPDKTIAVTAASILRLAEAADIPAAGNQAIANQLNSLIRAFWLP